MKYFSLYLAFFRANLMKDMAYRGNFLLGSLTTALESLMVYFGVAVLFRHVTTIAQWTYEEMLILLGVYMISNSAAWLLFRAGVSDLDRTINRGDLDWYLVKPIDAQFLSTVTRIDIEDAARSLVGLVLVGLGLYRGTAEVSFWRLLAFVITFLAGQAILYSIQLALKTVSFKSLQGWATNSIAFRFHDLAQYPTDIYRGLMRVVYTFVLPLAFIATVPAKALIGEITAGLFALSLLIAAAALAITRLIWKRALRTYTSASS
ncbi:MAG: hypothetical protein UY92_C0003G0055 [Candidatus Magasanikbacteria bacterium GW2011_GWA2_56_11]|uniref:ABC transporter permease n=1 Tax=Candidatus Magasanikbacteria bacterium GW2011_GWA2_56_11 TaxID=1619044 RepID=A0A0G2BBD7_9BACT|nr:MAG: hypothetical protein UY92_C0003G0055 [Candidatus Magasanikbacteria bacterium GW2011_GWA2_56_11]